jgi:hypothetical protein
MRQHNVWCVCVVLCVERRVGLDFYNFKNFKTFKFSDFNKEPTSSLKMFWKDRNMLESF